MPFSPVELQAALEQLGALIAARGQAFDLAIVGGGALLLVGLIERSTKDLDAVALIEQQIWRSAEPLPEPLAIAVKEIAALLDLEDNWLNAGPASLMDHGLPTGFADRVTVQVFGGLTLRLASRVDQIALKLYAAADRWPMRNNRHLSDLQRLAPSVEELRHSAAWCRTHDPSEGFLTVQLAPVLATFGVTIDG